MMPFSSTAFLICLFCFIASTNAVATGALRLYRNGVADTSQSWSSGIVQIYYTSQWGNICDDDNFGSDEADVICHQLGYTGATSYSNTGTTTTWGSDSSSTLLDEVSCSTSSYLTITQCSFNTNINSLCNTTRDVTVTCDSTRIWNSPTTGDIRLTGGTYSNEGLLEVYCNGQWGTVCDNSFFSTEARIACAQLGYNYYLNYDHLTLPGTVPQNIWLNTAMSCSSSTDTCLTSCGTCPVSAITSCTHTEDVTLECRYHPSYTEETTTVNNTDCIDRAPAPLGTIRLFRNGIPDTSQSWSSGIVQIYYSSQWGNICDDSSFGSDEADVICHQLGYTGASSYSNTGTTTTWGSDSSFTVMDDVSCSSSYLTITQCSFSTTINVACTANSDVVVTCYSTRIWSTPNAGDIRLTGGKYSNEGLLEVYCNGQWGTVCDNSFYSTEARIACRQLGYNYYDSYDQLTQRGNSTQNIWLNTLTSCSSSTDTCLTSCGSCPTSAITICSHSEDVTLSCEYDTSYGQVSQVVDSDCRNIDTAGSATQGAVRLYRNGLGDISQSWSSGIVQIYYSSQWGNICDDSSFGSDEADVICHQLGYTGASSYSNTGTTTTWGTDPAPVNMDEVSCDTSSYLTITQCSFSTIISSTTCTESDDVTVTCYSTRIWDSPSTGDIRLTGGTYSNQGLLEVYCNGQWGTVCDDNFYSTQAQVACRQLGYNYYDSYDNLPLQGLSTQNIWLRTLSGCFSSESCLTGCGGCPSSGVTGCSHSEDITLTCEYSTGYFKVPTDTSASCDITDASTTNADIVNTSNLTGIIVGSTIGFMVCLFIIIFVPICISICFGVGVRSAISSSTRTRTHNVAAAATVVTTTTDTVETKSADTVGYNPAGVPSGGGMVYYPADPKSAEQQQQQQQPPTGGYSTQPPPPYSPTYQQAPPTAYSTQPQYPPVGYPEQQAPPSGYPAQQVPYPTQPYPDSTYPQQPPEAYPPPV